MKTKLTQLCEVDSCSRPATFADRALTHFACTRHARKGFTVYPPNIQIALGATPTYYREGMGNLLPLSGFPR